MAIWTPVKTLLATIRTNRKPPEPVTTDIPATVDTTATTDTPATTYTTVLNDISQRVAACATTVSTTLGPGLPEVIYENALAHELRTAGLGVAQQHDVAVYYKGVIVGDYTADLLVEDTVLVKLKVATVTNAFDTTQCTNYLKATGHACTVLLNFGNLALEINCVVNGS